MLAWTLPSSTKYMFLSKTNTETHEPDFTIVTAFTQETLASNVDIPTLPVCETSQLALVQRRI